MRLRSDGLEDVCGDVAAPSFRRACLLMGGGSDSFMSSSRVRVRLPTAPETLNIDSPGKFGVKRVSRLLCDVGVKAATVCLDVDAMEVRTGDADAEYGARWLLYIAGGTVDA